MKLRVWLILVLFTGVFVSPNSAWAEDAIVWYLNDVITGITGDVFPIASNDDVSSGSVIVLEIQTVADSFNGTAHCDVYLNNGYEYLRILVTD